MGWTIKKRLGWEGEMLLKQRKKIPLIIRISTFTMNEGGEEFRYQNKLVDLQDMEKD